MDGPDDHGTILSSRTTQVLLSLIVAVLLFMAFRIYFTDIYDMDGDGLSDSQEELFGLDSHNRDTDGDGVDDGMEALWWMDSDGDGKINALDTDSDNDGVPDGTDSPTADTDRDGVPNMLDTDSDNDGIDDGKEVAAGTDFLAADSDGDGVEDGMEALWWMDSDGDGKINALDTDSDNDGVPDGEESSLLDTDGDGTVNMLDSDSDNDGIEDGDEVASGTSPLMADTDSDGINDNEEYEIGTSPLSDDSDGDGMPDGWEYSNGLDPLSDEDASSDEDWDGLTNRNEYFWNTDPQNEDSDDDGMPDGWEARYAFEYMPGVFSPDPAYYDSYMDPDRDGCPNYWEYLLGLSPSVGDTDGDGLLDGEEAVEGFGGILRNGVFTTSAGRYTTSALSNDTDGDGISDYDEVKGEDGYYTNASNSDTDGDGLTDSEEIEIYRTSPVLADSDSDKLTDSEEIFGTYGWITDPNRADTDMDGALDGEEELEDFNDNLTGVQGSNPLVKDTDGDGMPDGWEIHNGYDGARWVVNPLIPDAQDDPDGDHLTNIQEYNVPTLNQGHTDPLSWDTDGDGMPDGWEVAMADWVFDDDNGVWYWNLDPTDPSDGDADNDNDGYDGDGNGIVEGAERYTNLEEYRYGEDIDGDGYNEITTDPNDIDTDHDGIIDGKEIWFDDWDGDGYTNGWEETHGTDPFGGAYG